MSQTLTTAANQVVSDSLNIQQLYQTLKEQQSQKIDTVISSSKLRYKEGHLTYEDPKFGQLLVEPTEVFDNTISAKLGIPIKYYRKMRQDSPELLDRNVNHWLKKIDRPYLIRNFVPGRDTKKGKGPRGGTARAFLSDRFDMTMDNINVMTAFLEAIKQAQQEQEIQLQVSECNITDKKMYVRVVSPTTRVEARELLKNYRRPDGQGGVHGDTDYGVFSGLILSNSEVGWGSLYIQPMMWVSLCTNESIFKEHGIRKIHTGAQMEEGVSYQADTMAAMLESAKLQTRDAVLSFLNPEFLQGRVQDFSRWNTTFEQPIEAAKNVAQELKFSDHFTEQLINSFAKSGDMTAFGLQQAITWEAKHGLNGHGNKHSMDTRYDITRNSYQWMKKAKSFDKEAVPA